MILSRLKLTALVGSLAIAIILAFAMPPASAAPKCEAATFVINAGKTYDQAARANSASAFANGVARYSDMRSTALFALGRYRKLLPKAREGEFIALTKKFMGEFMLENGKDFRVGTMTITECSGSGGNIRVTAKTSSGDTVAFRIAKTGSGFTVLDMRANSIWLVQQMRSTFVGTISSHNDDIDALFKYLKR